jgi:adenylate cyclase
MAETPAPFHDGRMAEPHALERLILPRVEPRVAEGPPGIAVLPLRAAGPDPVPDYFAAGLADDVVSHLTTRQELTVISSASCLVFRDQPTDLMRVRAMLGVRYVVAGSVARSGNALRISVQLAETESGTALWGRTYRTVDTELFDAQENIAQQIVGTVIPRVREAELRRIQGKHPSSLTAYDLVLRARDLTYRLEPVTFEEAGQLLRRARQLDPRYAVAHAVYSDWLSLRIGQGWSPDPRHDARQGDDAAHAAIASDHMNARALALLGRNRSFLFRDYAGAEAIFQRALDVAPNESSAWMWSACTLAYVGDSSGALRRAERALDLSPYDPHAFRYFGTLCVAHYTNGTYEEAVHWGQRAIAENPHYTSNLRFTTAALCALGRMDAARRLGAEIMRLEPGFRVNALRERHPYADPARRDKIADHLRIAGLPE